MESEDVGGWDPGDKLNRRLAALRSSPEKADTIDALEVTESGREECEEEEDICESTTNPRQRPPNTRECWKDNELW